MAVLNPQKRARVLELAKTGLYSRIAIKEDLLEKFGSSMTDKTLTKVLTEEKITLPQIQDTERFKKIKNCRVCRKK